MRISRTRLKAAHGFTLVEFTIALFMTLALGSSLMVLLNQHVVTYQMTMQSSFLVSDAPRIGSLLNRILNQVDHYFVYGSKANALSGTGPVNSNGVAVRLYFRTPTGAMDQGLIICETSGTETQLNYYAYNNGWPANASWNISNRAQSVVFDNSTGILLATLTGPLGEQLTYAGASQ